MQITCRVETQYGQERIYVVSREKTAIWRLTGRKTVSYSDLDALYDLGITIEWITS